MAATLSGCSLQREITGTPTSLAVSIRKKINPRGVELAKKVHIVSKQSLFHTIYDCVDYCLRLFLFQIVGYILGHILKNCAMIVADFV